MGSEPTADEAYERDERTLDVIFWLLPIGAAALGLAPFVLVAVVLLGWDGTGAAPGLLGLAGTATIVLVTRRVVAQRRRERAPTRSAGPVPPSTACGGPS